VTDVQQGQALTRYVTARYQRLDILVNSAGIDVTVPFPELSVENWDRIVAVNLCGPFLLARAVFPDMRRQGRGP
jgi:NAD(P)-dependent dehydrogenase (short-subunit alcohol dehydrogenase family)